MSSADPEEVSVEIRREGVSVEKSFEPDDFPVPAIAFVIRSERDVPVDVALVDTRSQDAFFDGHLPASLLAPMNKLFPTVVGSFVEEDTPIYLIAESEYVREAVIDLIRIGLDDIVGYITPATLEVYADAGGELAAIETTDFATAEERRRRGEGRILDVRSSTEYREAHLEDSTNIAHTRLLVEKDQLPKDETWMVHCQSSARAAVSAGLLDRYGYDVVFIGETFDDYRESGAELATSTPSVASV